MRSTDVAVLERRLRWTYELARARRALLGLAPLLLVVAVVACITDRPGSAVGFGAATFVGGAMMLWYGREPQRAVLPGIAAGLVPLALALCANQVHTCGAGGCSSLCVPACVLGGLVAGLAVASIGHRRRAGVWFWVPASGLALLTGAMGCACVGYSGVVGLGLGFAAGALPGVVRHVVGGRAR